MSSALRRPLSFRDRDRLGAEDHVAENVDRRRAIKIDREKTLASALPWKLEQRENLQTGEV
jgi:hypothetical protein